MRKKASDLEEPAVKMYDTDCGPVPIKVAKQSRLWRRTKTVIKWATLIGFVIFLVVFIPKFIEAGRVVQSSSIEDLFAAEQPREAIITQDGKVMAVLSVRKPVYIPYDELPKRPVQALLAVEDVRYFSWWRRVLPIDPIGIAKAGWTNLMAWEWRAGGSTIVQMLARRLYLTREKTGSRKLWELAYACQLIYKYSLEELLAAFVCYADFGAVNGQLITGAPEASDAFYQKPLQELTDDELAVLWGVLNATTANNPVHNAARSQLRRNVVLDAWVNNGFITNDRRKRLVQLPVRPNPRKIVTKYGEYPHLVKQALAEWEKIAGKLRAEGKVVPPPELLRIETTYDSEVTAAWHAAFRTQLPKLGGKLQGAGAVIDYRTGDVLDFWGGADFLNRYALAERQPGSVFKLFVYALAMAMGKITPETLFRDEPRAFAYGNGAVFHPENFHKDYSNGLVPAKDALALSKNVIACTVAESVGYKNIVAFARALGLEIVKDEKGNLHPTPSITLGSYEVTMPQLLSALTIFANAGKQATVQYIRKVEGPDGELLYEAEPQLVDRLSPEIAAAVLQMMVGCAKYGTGKGLFPFLVALKTGSSRDGWLVGFTPGGLLFAVYVGYDNPGKHATEEITGATTAGVVAQSGLTRMYGDGKGRLSAYFVGQFPAMPSTSSLLAHNSPILGVMFPQDRAKGAVAAATPTMEERVKGLIVDPVEGIGSVPVSAPSGVITIPDGPLKKPSTSAPTPVARQGDVITIPDGNAGKPKVITIPDGPLKKP